MNSHHRCQCLFLLRLTYLTSTRVFAGEVVTNILRTGNATGLWPGHLAVELGLSRHRVDGGPSVRLPAPRRRRVHVCVRQEIHRPLLRIQG